MVKQSISVHDGEVRTPRKTFENIEIFSRRKRQFYNRSRMEFFEKQSNK